ncbi:MAG: glycosyltransferase family 4 protein [Verrucomicrobia bacterium]|nr:glycosyltransferase family 4 protein [Verrucomicrobiota bacterium]
MSTQERKSKLLFVSPSGIGGLQSFCIDLSEAFRNLGYEVHILFEQREAASEPNPPAPTGVTAGVFAHSPFDNCYHVFTRMADFIRDGAFDIVYPNTSSVAYRAIGLLGPRRPVAVGACHGYNEHDFACNTEFVGYLDHIFAVSNLAAEELRRRLAGADIGVTAIPLGLPSMRAAPPHTFAGPLQIAFAGRLAHIKRIGDMIEVARRLREAGLDFRLRIVGGGPLRGELTRQVAACGLEGHVGFTGFLPRSELDGLWQTAHLTFLLSESEGFGLSVLEAMRFGCVPIVTETCGCREAIRNGDSGFVVQLGDVDKVTALVRQLDRDRDYLGRMSAEAACTVREEYAFEKEVARHLEAIRQAQDHHRRYVAEAVSWKFQPASFINHPWVPNWLAKNLRRAQRRLGR